MQLQLLPADIEVPIPPPNMLQRQILRMLPININHYFCLSWRPALFFVLAPGAWRVAPLFVLAPGAWRVAPLFVLAPGAWRVAPLFLLAPGARRVAPLLYWRVAPLFDWLLATSQNSLNP